MDNKYLADFQIVGNSIKNLKIKNDFISLENSNTIRKKIDISHSVERVEKIEEDTLLFGTVILNVEVLLSEKKKKYQIDMSMEGSFSAPAEMGEDTFKRMLQVNGITSLYSIARGFVQSVSSQSLAYGSVLLPMLNVVAYSKDLSEKIL